MSKRVIDADGHIREPAAVWDDYVDKDIAATNPASMHSLSAVRRRVTDRIQAT